MRKPAGGTTTYVSLEIDARCTVATPFAVRDLELSRATEQSRERDRSGTGRSKSVANVAARQRPDKLRP